MARVSQPPAPPPVPFWQVPAFRWGVVAVVVMVALTGLLWLEKQNRMHQLERRIREDVRLGPMAVKLRQQIELARNSGILADEVQAARQQVPQALWLGRVAPLRESDPQDGSILVLAEAHLIAGKAGPRDRDGQVRIGRRKHFFPGGPPQPGETWLVSVWRDGPGNVIHSAARFSP